MAGSTHAHTIEPIQEQTNLQVCLQITQKTRFQTNHATTQVPAQVYHAIRLPNSETRNKTGVSLQYKNRLSQPS
jgi:polyphosphate kinase